MVCKTPSTTKAKLDSASRVDVRPRMVTSVSPTLTVFAITTFGVKAIKSSGLSMPASLISLEVKTLIAIGTSCTLSSTFRADTTTSSRVGSASNVNETEKKEKANANRKNVLEIDIVYPLVKNSILILFTISIINTTSWQTPLYVRFIDIFL